MQRLFLIYSFVIFCVLQLTTFQTRADEPAEKFLEALRENGYYDVAIDYLQEIEKSSLVAESFKKEIPFERAKTLIRSTAELVDPAKVELRLDEAQQLLTTYAANNNSLKTSAKTLRFQGNVLYRRSAGYLRQSESDRLTAAERNVFLNKARTMLTGSLESYTNARTEIRRLIDPNSDNAIILDAEDPSTKQERDMFQTLYTDVRVALPLVAEKLGDTFPEGSPQRKKQLENAAKEYEAVYSSYRRFFAGLKACVYAARCKQKLGDNQGALDQLADIFDLGNHSDLKPLKLEGYGLASDCWSKMSPYPHVEIVKILDKEVGGLNRMEIKNPDWIRVQLELAKAKHAYAADIKEKGGPRASSESKAMDRAAAKVLRNVARAQSKYRDTARELLSQWNVSMTEVADPNEAAPATFIDARQKGKDVIGEIEIILAEANQLRVKIAKERDPGKKQPLQKQLDELDEQVATNAARALDWFSMSLDLADDSTVRADINNVRYLQSFCYFVSKQYYESALLGEFLLAKYPTVDGTRQAMSLLIKSYSYLLDAAKDTEKEYWKGRLTAACDKSLTRWPGSNEAGSAGSTMTRLRLIESKFGEAEKYFLQIPGNNSSRNALATRLGQRMFSDYRSKVRGGADATTLQPQLGNSTKYMEDGVNSTTIDNLDLETAYGAVRLVDAYMYRKDVGNALKQLEEAPIAPLELVKRKHPVVASSSSYSSETYKTAIKVYLAAMAQSDNKQEWTDKAKGIIDGMRREMEGSNDPKAQARLTAIYRTIAQDLLKEFEQITEPNEKKRFAGTLADFLGSIEKDANDAKTVLWAGSTLLSVADSLAQSGAKPAAEPYFEQAVSALNRAEQMGFKGDPQESLMMFKLKRQRALAKRGRGDYEGAVKQFVEILKGQSALNVQVDAAKTLQMWGKAAKRERAYAEALKGASSVKDPKTKKTKKLIWGWEKIFMATRKIEKYRATSLEALYHIAECRMEYGILSNKKSAIKSAIREIENERKRNPGFGGNAEWETKLNGLIKRAQAAGG